MLERGEGLKELFKQRSKGIKGSGAEWSKPRKELEQRLDVSLACWRTIGGPVCELGHEHVGSFGHCLLSFMRWCISLLGLL